MEQTNKHFAVEQQIELLTEHYENALKKGKEFSELKNIREKLRMLKVQLPDYEDTKDINNTN